MVYEKVVKACAAKGVSIYRAEKDMNLPNATIVKWKHVVPSAKNLKKISAYFGLPIEYFIED